MLKESTKLGLQLLAADPLIEELMNRHGPKVTVEKLGDPGFPCPIPGFAEDLKANREEAAQVLAGILGLM